MASQPSPDNRLIAALCYLCTPVVPLVALRGGRGKVDDAWVQRHARQALLWAVPFLVLLMAMVIGMVLLVREDILFICLLPLGFLLPLVPGAYWAKRVYFGGDVMFPGSKDSHPQD